MHTFVLTLTILEGAACVLESNPLSRLIDLAIAGWGAYLLFVA